MSTFDFPVDHTPQEGYLEALNTILARLDDLQAAIEDLTAKVDDIVLDSGVGFDIEV